MRIRHLLCPIVVMLYRTSFNLLSTLLFILCCLCLQRRVAFDQVYGWEMTLLEPTDYWRRVPPNWKPYWHFHNVPIDADLAHPDNPVRYMQQIATERDFVAFKLDIDHPAMEMPLAMRMLQDPALYTLIDEFFFELHFRCVWSIPFSYS